MIRVFAAAAAVAAVAHATRTYTVVVSNKGAVPAMSIKKAPGTGYSPCEYTFNPAWLDGSANPAALNHSILILRVANCPASDGGSVDHLMYAECSDDGTCGDLNPMQFTTFETGAEDPRVFFYESQWWMYYYAPGPGQDSVYLRKTSTPLDPTSWELVVGQLPWHRNGCVILRPNGTHYVIYGETGALPGLGIATTTDFKTYNYLNKTWMEPNGPNNTMEPEVVLEASTAPVQLSTGDYLHIYAAGTPGWVANGNYTAGFVILDKDDPTVILQRSKYHVFMPTMDYEIGDGIWPVQRNRTMFVTSIVPVQGQTDTYRVWYGAADANVATAILTVTYTDQ